MKKLVINADDFGLCDSINSGIIHCLENGIVSDLSFLVNLPYLKDSIELLQKKNIRNIGIHLNFTMGKPIKSEYNSLTDSNGDFYSTSKHFNNYLLSKLNINETIEKQSSMKCKKMLMYYILADIYVIANYKETQL